MLKRSEIATAVETLMALRATAYARLEDAYAAPQQIRKIRHDAEFFTDYAAIVSGNSGRLVEAAAALRDAAAAVDAAESLEPEFNRLFVGPGRLPAPPYGSVYTSPDGLVFGETTIDARLAYLEAGFAPITIGREPDDSITTQLGFMLALQHKQIEAVLHGENPSPWGARQLVFLNEHLLRWTPAFFNRVRSETRIPWFGAMAEFAGELLQSDSITLETLAQAQAQAELRVGAGLNK